MPILNYTTKIEAETSITEIQKCLASHGAKSIKSDYDDSGHIVALSFLIALNGQEIAFRLPSDWRPVLDILKGESDKFVRQRNGDRKRAVPIAFVTQAQALRVSWRILKDWVEAQMALVEVKMASTAQVFMPYAITRDGGTLYDKFATSPTNLLGSGNAEA